MFWNDKRREATTIQEQGKTRHLTTASSMMWLMSTLMTIAGWDDGDDNDGWMTNRLDGMILRHRCWGLSICFVMRMSSELNSLTLFVSKASQRSQC